jgi:hypothetical protein
VLTAFEGRGYASNFAARDPASVECLTCRNRFPARDLSADAIERLEGASDPDDMLAVVALTCPACGARGSLVLSFGPEASVEDAEVLAGIEGPRA